MGGPDKRSSGGGPVVTGSGNIVSGANSTIIIGAQTQAMAQPQRPHHPKPATAAPDVFISYAREDRALIDPLVTCLDVLAVNVWTDHNLAPGGAFTNAIAHELNRCRVLIVGWTEQSAGSEWVQGEAKVGHERGVLLPVLLAPTTHIPPPYNVLHTVSLSGWTGEPDHPGWQAILAELARRLGRPGLRELDSLIHTRNESGLRDWSMRHRDDPFTVVHRL